MEDFKVIFLGTANAVPTKDRNHTAIYLTYKNESFLVDCGEGTQRQFRYAGISPVKITRIFITHWHGDHILGIPGLLQTLAMSGYNRKLEIYCPKGSRRFLEAIEKLMIDFRVNLEIHEVGRGKIIDEKDFYVEVREMNHGIPTNAYSFVLRDKLRLDRFKLKKFKLPNSPLLGKLQAGEDIIFNEKKIKSKDVTYLEKGKKVTLILDTGYTEEAVKLSKDADVLVIESSFSSKEKDKAAEYKHLTAEQAAMIAKKSKVKRLILTHISQRYENNLSIIEKEAKKIFKKTEIVKDLDKIIF